jgi:hypothetical protein
MPGRAAKSVVRGREVGLVDLDTRWLDECEDIEPVREVWLKSQVGLMGETLKEEEAEVAGEAATWKTG